MDVVSEASFFTLVFGFGCLIGGRGFRSRSLGPQAFERSEDPPEQVAVHRPVFSAASFGGERRGLGVFKMMGDLV